MFVIRVRLYAHPVFPLCIFNQSFSFLFITLTNIMKKYKLWTFPLCGFRPPESYVHTFSTIRSLFPQTLMHACTSPEFLVAQIIKFLKVVTHISIKTNALIFTHKNVYHFICIQHEAPDNSEVYRTVGPQCGTGFKPQLWCIEFGSNNNIY
jgi:hypothetical protein